MKTKFLTLLLLISFSIAVSAQSWQTYENKLYVSPVNTFVGIGTNIPAYNLDIDGRLRIRYSNVINGWGYSYLYWSFHSLVMGTPEGSNSHNSIDLIPGGNDNQPETFFSQIRFFSTTSTNQHDLKIELNSEGNCWFNNPHNFGIGTTTPHYKLDVNGTIHATEILVSIPTGADFVFDKNYSLPTLKDVEAYIKDQKHLPDIQSADEMEQNGVNLNELTIQLLQKVEELTLYIIEQDKRIEELEQQLK